MKPGQYARWEHGPVSFCDVDSHDVVILQTEGVKGIPGSVRVRDRATKKIHLPSSSELTVTDEAIHATEIY